MSKFVFIFKPETQMFQGIVKNYKFNITNEIKVSMSSKSLLWSLILKEETGILPL